MVLGKGQSNGCRHIQAGSLGLYARHLRTGTGNGSIQSVGVGSTLGQIQSKGFQQVGRIGHCIQLAAKAAAGLIGLFLQFGSTHLVGACHDLIADGAGLGCAGADVIQSFPEFLQQPVQICTDGGCHGVTLVGNIGGTVHPYTAGSRGVRFQRSGDVAADQANAYRCTHGCPAARCECRHAGVAVAAVESLHQHIGHGENVLALGVLSGNDGALDGVQNIDGLQTAAGEQSRLDDVVDHRHGYAGIKGDALGVGAAGSGLGQLLVGSGTQGRHILKGFVPPGNGVAARHGHGIHIIPEGSQNGQRPCPDNPVAQSGDAVSRNGLGTDHSGDHSINQVGSEGSTHAHRAAGLTGRDCLGSHAQRLISTGGSRGINLLCLIGLHPDISAGSHVRLVADGIPSGDGGTGHCMDDGDGRGTGHAYTCCTHAGNRLGGNGMAYAVQLAAGGKLGGEQCGKGFIQVVDRKAQLGHLGADLVQNRHLQAVAVAQVRNPVVLFAHHGKDVFNIGQQSVRIELCILLGGVDITGEASLDLLGQDVLVILGTLDPLGLFFVFGAAGNTQQFIHGLFLLLGKRRAAALGQLE